MQIVVRLHAVWTGFQRTHGPEPAGRQPEAHFQATDAVTSEGGKCVAPLCLISKYQEEGEYTVAAYDLLRRAERALEYVG